jgi:hypothetical protein
VGCRRLRPAAEAEFIGHSQPPAASGDPGLAPARLPADRRHPRGDVTGAADRRHAALRPSNVRPMKIDHGTARRSFASRARAYRASP